MDGAPTTSGSRGGGGPAPFLLKTYEMVDDSKTDEIVSWSSNKNSFVVWNPPEKPIHSHSNPQGSVVDPERAVYDEEIDRLTREKVALEANISRSKQQRSAAKLQVEDLKQRVDNMEQRQDGLLTFLVKALVNPTFAEILARKIDSRPDFGNVFQQDFSSKLRLELSPAVSDINLVSHSTQSSNEDGESLQRRISGEPKGVQMRTEGFVIPPETLDLSDTGTSFTLQIDSTLSQKVPINESPSLHPLQPSLTSNEEAYGERT
uniref:HSF-type DNA-binding domain-containing protein n=1 Tax=Fagus sylvatica TaxID=28930 RepID=A0A2N9IWV1_FAGSY